MQKVVVVYSSQNGSTQKIVERMKAVFIQEENEIDLFNAGQGEKINLDNYDLIGIGCPVYMFRPSYEITDFLKMQKNLKGKKVFTFVTYGSEVGDGANWLRSKIKKMGAIDAGHFSCSGKHLFPGYTGRGYLFSPEGPADHEFKACDSFVQNVLLKIDSNNFTNSNSYDAKTHLISRFERFVTNRFLIKNLYSRFFRVNKKLCTSCGTCIKNCPTKNIKKDTQNQIKWGRNCILCTQCEISCPKKAVSSPISWFIFTPFLTYNIKRTIRNKIPYKLIS